MSEPEPVPSAALDVDLVGRGLRASRLDLLLGEEATLLVFLRHLG